MTDAAEDKNQKPVIAPIVYQRTLMPVAIVDTYPNTSGTLNLQWIGRGANGKDYAIKTTKDHNSNGFIPATELFCYELAAELLIPTPEYTLLSLSDGSIAFGSVWEGGVQDIQTSLSALDDKIIIKGLTGFLSKVYAFDVFINNIDRHFGNYLIRESYNGHVILAFDFSLAWYAFNAYGYEAAREPHNTMQWHQFIKAKGHFDLDIAKSTLSEIAKIPKQTIERIIMQIPDEWLAQDIKTEIVQWWDSNERIERINQLKAGLK